MTDIPTIDREELRAALEAGSLVVLDAQGDGWHARERLPGAIRARPHDLVWLAGLLPQGKETPVAVYCWSETCFASGLTAEWLAARGYSNVRRYVGGKRDWIEAGLPVEADE